MFCMGGEVARWHGGVVSWWRGGMGKRSPRSLPMRITLGSRHGSSEDSACPCHTMLFSKNIRSSRRSVDYHDGATVQTPSIIRGARCFRFSAQTHQLDPCSRVVRCSRPGGAGPFRLRSATGPRRRAGRLACEAAVLPSAKQRRASCSSLRAGRRSTRRGTPSRTPAAISAATSWRHPIQHSRPARRRTDARSSPKQAHRWSVLRAVRTEDNAHSASGYYMLTGRPHSPKGQENATAKEPNLWPSFGAVAGKLLPRRGPLPGAITLPEHIWNTGMIPWPGQDAGFLGRDRGPLADSLRSAMSRISPCPASTCRRASTRFV